MLRLASSLNTATSKTGADLNLSFRLKWNRALCFRFFADSTRPRRLLFLTLQCVGAIGLESRVTLPTRSSEAVTILSRLLEAKSASKETQHSRTRNIVQRRGLCMQSCAQALCKPFEETRVEGPSEGFWSWLNLKVCGTESTTMLTVRIGHIMAWNLICD